MNDNFAFLWIEDRITKNAFPDRRRHGIQSSHDIIYYNMVLTFIFYTASQ